MASAEARSPSLRKLVWHNLELLQDALSHRDGHERAADLICQSLPEKFDIMRVHVGGDYFSRNYFLAWCMVAERNPDKVFYSYTKSLAIVAGIPKPDNLVLTASRGGKRDNLIDEKGWKEARVVYSEEEAADLGLEIDHDDTHAAFGRKVCCFRMVRSQKEALQGSVESDKQKEKGSPIEVVYLVFHSLFEPVLEVVML